MYKHVCTLLLTYKKNKRKKSKNKKDFLDTGNDIIRGRGGSRKDNV